MIGLIQKILLDLVEEKAGPEAVKDVKEIGRCASGPNISNW